MSTPVIEVIDLKRRYGGKDGFEAVKGISFDVRAGELFKRDVANRHEAVATARRYGWI